MKDRRVNELSFALSRARAENEWLKNELTRLNEELSRMEVYRVIVEEYVARFGKIYSVCSVCGGLGYTEGGDDGKKIKCPVCSGKGVIFLDRK